MRAKQAIILAMGGHHSATADCITGVGHLAEDDGWASRGAELFSIHCNSHGCASGTRLHCSNWTTVPGGYGFDLLSTDDEQLTMNLPGRAIGFSPQRLPRERSMPALSTRYDNASSLNGELERGQLPVSRWAADMQREQS